jgi:uncharacterized membrane protein
MSTNRPVEVDRYLQRLDAALVDVSPHTADEIRAGVVEELSSLEAEDARERIAQLGDPEFIAAEARRDADDATPSRTPVLRSRAYIITASLTVAVGVYVVPLVGALIGFVLVWVSTAWTRWEKVLATVIPLTCGTLTATFFVIARISAGDPTTSVATGVAPGEEFSDPLYPLYITPPETLNVLFVVSIANAAVGLWLLVRALRRS